MAAFDLIKQPHLSSDIYAAEKRTKLSTQGTPQVCGCVQACAQPFFIRVGPLLHVSVAGTHTAGRPQM